MTTDVGSAAHDALPTRRSRREAAERSQTGERQATIVPRKTPTARSTVTPAGGIAVSRPETHDESVKTDPGQRASIGAELLALEQLSRSGSAADRAERRRQIRGRNDRANEHAMPRSRRNVAWVPRAAVVAALAIATVGLPSGGALGALQDSGVTALVADDDGTGTTEVALGDTIGSSASVLGPTTFSIVQQSVAQPSTPAEMAQTLSSEERALALVSRSEVRSPLPGCDPSVVATGSNGNLSQSQLCELPQGGGYYLQPDAAVAFAEMSRAFEVRFGTALKVTSAYRSYGQQVGLHSNNPGMTAAAGKSNHGWGLAVDFDRSSYVASDRWAWLQANAAYFGFGNPDWAKGRRYEPWHWEYMPGVLRVGNDGGTGYAARLAAAGR